MVERYASIVKFPSLYSIVNNKNVHVADVLVNAPLNIRFRHVLKGERWDTWLDLVSRLMNVQLISNGSDKFSWKLMTLWNFSIKFLYADYMNGHIVF
jgi:hypothetical protein